MDAQLSPGDMVGDYRIEGPLGTGGMAHVYRAVGPDGQQVALKLILAELAVQKSFRQRFELETSIARRVAHPNVVSVLDSGVHGAIPWLTQTLITGGSLVDLLDREGGALPVDRAVTIAEQVAAGLDVVHAEGLVHRDVKPPNILLTDEGNACITDFGLARDTTADTRLTRPGQTLGSMDYMAPEQVTNEDVGPFTDVYSLGCVLFECVAGETPFASHPGMGRMLAHLQSAPPHPSDVRAELPRALGDAVLLALAKAPADRPAGAGEYAALVRAAL